jgi:hypothetical protein
MKTLRMTILAAALTALAGWSGAERPELRLRVYDLAGMSTSNLTAALSQTALVFNAAGIDLVWQTGDASAPEAHLLDESPVKEPGRLLPVVVVRITDGGGFPAEVLGHSLPFAQSGAHISIFCDHIRQFQARGNIAVPKLLGYALAHELGHVLMQSGKHTARGLMRFEWGAAEFQCIEQSALKFTKSEALEMRTALQEVGGEKIECWRAERFQLRRVNSQSSA